MDMQDSLGGNSKTTIIATVSPSSWFVLMAALISDHYKDFKHYAMVRVL